MSNILTKQEIEALIEDCKDSSVYDMYQGKTVDDVLEMNEELVQLLNKISTEDIKDAPENDAELDMYMEYYEECLKAAAA